MQRIALLESEKHGGKAGAGSAASVALHTVILALAIAVTSHAGSRAHPENAIFVPLPKFQPEVKRAAQPAAPKPASPKPVAPSISVPVPTLIPATIPSPNVTTVPATTIGTQPAAVPGGIPGTDTATVVRGNEPFSDVEVDVAASVIPGQRGPVYPEGLRAMGVEGRVVARFVIGKNGRVEDAPAIVSSTADEFSAAVKRYLAGARYRPATVRGEPVRQLAEQEFDFAVRR